MALYKFDIPWLSEPIKKCTIKYLIQRYLGHFLYEELDLSQLNIELFSGKGSITGIPLNVNTINEEVSPYVPLKFLQGYVDRLDVSIPWSSLWTESCTIHLDGIKLEFCKLNKCQSHDPNQMSILSKSLMTSSMEMAGEIVKQESEKFDGLEMFAKLIDSVIRRFKLSASNTVIKFILPQKNGQGQEIQLRIGSLLCEEEELTLNDSGKDDGSGGGGKSSTSSSTTTNNKQTRTMSDVITKRITMEGVEILINDILITKLYGKHTFKVRYDGKRVDMEAYLGSYIFAILNSDHLKILQEFFKMLDDSSKGSFNFEQMQHHQQMLSKVPQERKMTPSDFKVIQEMMPKESGKPGGGGGRGTSKQQQQQSANPMTSSFYSNKNWSTDANDLDYNDDHDDKFQSFNRNVYGSNQKIDSTGNADLDQQQSSSSSPTPSPTLFTCNLKVPGIVLCLISGDDNMPVFAEMPMIDSIQSFIGIHSFLNKILHDYDHIRLLASNLCLDFSCELVQFSCINVTMHEYYQDSINPILLVSDDNSDSTIQPSVWVKIDKEAINITLSSTSIKLDPTLIERHHKLVSLFIGDGSSASSSKLNSNNNIYSPASKYQRPTTSVDNSVNINIECCKVDIELYFPIPDLRPERSTYSKLHDEILLVELEDMSLRLDSVSGDLVCSQLNFDLKLADGEIKKLFHAESENKGISLNFSTLNSVPVRDGLDENVLLNEVSTMQESINFMSASTINHTKGSNNPFEVKRKMFGEEGNEQIVTPGDRSHIQHYLACNKDFTKFYLYIHVPDGDLFFENKALFELIYNRIVNDLILWTPYLKRKKKRSRTQSYCKRIEEDEVVENLIDLEDNSSPTIEKGSLLYPAPIYSLDTVNCTGADYDLHNPPLPPDHQTVGAPSFYSCKNTMSESYDSEASDTSFHSIANSTMSTLVNGNNIGYGINNSCGGGTTTASHLKPQNEFMLELEITNLSLDFCTDSKRRNSIYLQNLLLGIVSGPESEPNTVLCLCSDNLLLKSDDKHLLLGNSYMESNSNCTLNLSMDIKRESDMLKKIKLAVQLKRALLLGLELPIYEDLWSFLNLKDDDILGYVCPKVILELHTDIVQCGISFDNLKERQTLLHCEDIYLTSMVIENTNQTILRFFIEEALLCFKRNSHCAETLKNYIPVINSGIIDLNIKISKDGRLELKISNNEINLKVCPDSLATLFQFLQTFASSGTSAANIDPITMMEDVGDLLAHKEIYMRKNSVNGPDLIADALNECLEAAAAGKKKVVHTSRLPPEHGDCEGGMDGDDSLMTNGEDDDRAKHCHCDGSKIDESTFWMLGDDDLGTGINLTKEPQVRVLTEEPIKLIENHFKIANYKVIPEITASTLARYLLEKMSLRVSLYGGKDFDDIPNNGENGSNDTNSGEVPSTGKEQDSRSRNTNNTKPDVISQANLSMRSYKSTMMNGSMKGNQKVRFSQNSVTWENIDLASNNGYIMNNNHASETHFSFKCMGGSKRKNDTCVVVVLNRIKLLFENFDKDYELAWRFFFLVQEVEILDRVNASKIKKILYEYCSESTPRRKYSNMFSVRLTCQRNFQDQNEECDLKISLKPLRINLDQDTLIFLMEFFTQTSEELTAKLFSNNSSSNTANNNNNNNNGDDSNTSNKKRHNSKSDDGFGDEDNNDEEDEDDEDEDEDDMDVDEDDNEVKSNGHKAFRPPTRRRRRTSSKRSNGGRIREDSSSSNNSSSSFDNIFIKSFTFSPEVPISLDYHGKHIDLKQGALPGIFLGLAQLNQSELHLKKLVNKHGLLGLEKVLIFMVEEWGKDIKSNQLPSILGGFGPMHSFIQLFQGVRDLFWMPIDQYRRDQRIVRGIQRGAYAFSISTAMATLELANRLVSLIQTTAQFAHDVVTPPTPGGNYRAQLMMGPSIHNSQPRDFREGVAVAYTVMREGLHDTVQGVTNAGLVSNDVSAVIGEVVRNIPSTLVEPFIHVSHAASSVLIGMRNQLTPEARKDDHEKWKNANER